jgi:hypothetical protein
VAARRGLVLLYDAGVPAGVHVVLAPPSLQASLPAVKQSHQAGPMCAHLHSGNTELGLFLLSTSPYCGLSTTRKWPAGRGMQGLGTHGLSHGTELTWWAGCGRYCGYLICSTCSHFRPVPLDDGTTHVERVCTVCRDIL